MGNPPPLAIGFGNRELPLLAGSWDFSRKQHSLDLFPSVLVLSELVRLSIEKLATGEDALIAICTNAPCMCVWGSDIAYLA